MFQVWADVKKNRLYLKLGKLSHEEAREAARSVVREALKLRTGFTLLNDLTEYEALPQRVATLILSAQRSLVRTGLSRGVRVVRSAIAAMQFDRRGKEAGMDMVTVQSLEEGEKILEAWEKESKGDPEP